MKQRIEFIDLAKGICIILVVQIHVYGDTSFDVFNKLSIFRMPLYYFLSGIFFKTYGNFSLFIKKKTNRLLFPFLFFFICTIIPIHFLFDFYLQHQSVTIQELFFSDYGRFYHRYNGAIWFLVSLFITNVYFFIIHSIFKGHTISIVVATCICGIIGYYMNCMNIYLPMWLDTSMTALPFFVMGYITRHNTHFLSSTFCHMHYLYALISLLLLISVIAINMLLRTQLIDYDLNSYNMNIICLYIGGLSGIFLILFISKKLNKVYLISYIGRYSIVVLCTHILYIFIIRNILYQFSIPQNLGYINTSIFLFVILISIPTIKYGIKYLPSIFSQKDIWR